jgi:quinol-cytochrome oxidoreductase complex cytochrome b subunit
MMTTNVDKVKFNNYYSYKDLFILIAIFIVYLYVLFYLPNILGHTDNYNKANPMVTPTHIVPE